MHFVPFGWIQDRLFALQNMVQKGAELVQKFVPGSRVQIFHNKRTRSTPFEPKLTFWCISYLLCAFGTVWLPYETRGKTGRSSAKFRATKSRQNFLQRTHTPKHKFRVQWGGLGAFRTIWLPYETQWKTGQFSAKVRASKLRQNLSQRTHLIHPIWP